MPSHTQSHKRELAADCIDVRHLETPEESRGISNQEPSQRTPSMGSSNQSPLLIAIFVHRKDPPDCCLPTELSHIVGWIVFDYVLCHVYFITFSLLFFTVTPFPLKTGCRHQTTRRWPRVRMTDYFSSLQDLFLREKDSVNSLRGPIVIRPEVGPQMLTAGFIQQGGKYAERLFCAFSANNLPFWPKSAYFAYFPLFIAYFEVLWDFPPHVCPFRIFWSHFEGQFGQGENRHPHFFCNNRNFSQFPTISAFFFARFCEFGQICRVSAFFFGFLQGNAFD